MNRINQINAISAEQVSAACAARGGPAAVPVPLHQLQHPLQQDPGGQRASRGRGAVQHHEDVRGAGGPQVGGGGLCIITV